MKKILSLLLLAAELQAQQAISDTAAEIDKLLRPWGEKNMPGVSVAVSRNGITIYSNAVGLADLEHGVPNDSSTIFEAGSVSKQFTAAAILLLEQQGKLSLNDDVRKYVPELPDYGTPITIYHLMHHLSGLRDWGAVAEVEGWPRSTRAHSNAHALQIISRQKALNNIPGGEYIYSNSNYNLMAIIVERVSGESFAAFCRKQLFEPAGMSQTSWRNDYRQVVPRRAIAYMPSMTGFKTLMPFEDAHGNGGLLTTTGDLVRWTQFIFQAKPGGAPFLGKQLEKGRFNNGHELDYAAGLRVTRFNGQSLITHSGATAGYRANLDYFPESGLAIALLSNTAGLSPVELARKIAAIYYPSRGQEKLPEIRTRKTDPQKLALYAGWYRNTRSDEAMLIRQKDSLLEWSPGRSLLPMGDPGQGRFSLTGLQLQFQTTNGRRSYYLTDPDNPSDTLEFESAEAAPEGPDYLKGFTGTYQSGEANCRISISLSGNTLQWHREPVVPDSLKPTYRDGFEIPGGHIRFFRNGRKEVAGFHLSVGRARRILFRKA